MFRKLIRFVKTLATVVGLALLVAVVLGATYVFSLLLGVASFLAFAYVVVAAIMGEDTTKQE